MTTPEVAARRYIEEKEVDKAKAAGLADEVRGGRSCGKNEPNNADGFL